MHTHIINTAKLLLGPKGLAAVAGTGLVVGGLAMKQLSSYLDAIVNLGKVAAIFYIPKATQDMAEYAITKDNIGLLKYSLELGNGFDQIVEKFPFLAKLPFSQAKLNLDNNLIKSLSEGKGGIANVLIKSGANVNIEIDNKRALEVAIEKGLYKTAYDIIDTKNDAVNKQVEGDPKANNLLQKVLYAGNEELAKKAIESAPEEALNAPFKDGDYLAHKAVKNPALYNIAKDKINGENINKLNSKGESPVGLAIDGNHEIAIDLLEKGAALSDKTFQKAFTSGNKDLAKTATEKADVKVLERSFADGEYLSHKVVQDPDLYNIAKDKIAGTINNPDANGKYSIELAVDKNPDIAIDLINKGADLSVPVTDKVATNAFQKAFNSNDHKLIKTALDKGNPDLIKSKFKNGDTVAHKIAANPKLNTLVKESGVELKDVINSANEKSQTPLDIMLKEFKASHVDAQDVKEFVSQGATVSSNNLFLNQITQNEELKNAGIFELLYDKKALDLTKSDDLQKMTLDYAIKSSPALAAKIATDMANDKDLAPFINVKHVFKAVKTGNTELFNAVKDKIDIHSTVKEQNLFHYLLNDKVVFNEDIFKEILTQYAKSPIDLLMVSDSYGRSPLYKALNMKDESKSDAATKMLLSNVASKIKFKVEAEKEDIFKSAEFENGLKEYFGQGDLAELYVKNKIALVRDVLSTEFSQEYSEVIAQYFGKGLITQMNLSPETKSKIASIMGKDKDYTKMLKALTSGEKGETKEVLKALPDEANSDNKLMINDASSSQELIAINPKEFKLKEEYYTKKAAIEEEIEKHKDKNVQSKLTKRKTIEKKYAEDENEAIIMLNDGEIIKEEVMPKEEEIVIQKDEEIEEKPQDEITFSEKEVYNKQYGEALKIMPWQTNLATGGYLGTTVIENWDSIKYLLTDLLPLKHVSPEFYQSLKVASSTPESWSDKALKVLGYFSSAAAIAVGGTNGFDVHNSQMIKDIAIKAAGATTPYAISKVKFWSAEPKLHDASSKGITDFLYHYGTDILGDTAFSVASTLAIATIAGSPLGVFGLGTTALMAAGNSLISNYNVYNAEEIAQSNSYLAAIIPHLGAAYSGYKLFTGQFSANEYASSAVKIADGLKLLASISGAHQLYSLGAKAIAPTLEYVEDAFSSLLYGSNDDIKLNTPDTAEL